MPKASKKTEQNDPIALLKQDHARVQKLFEDFEKAHESEDDEAAEEIVETAIAELEAHAALEEEIFYPALRGAIDDESLVEEAEVEHESARMLIEQLKGMQSDDPKFAATFKVLSEYVQHHVEEEENEIFKQAKKAKIDTLELGEAMAARHEELALEMGLSDESDAEEADDESASSRRK